MLNIVRHDACLRADTTTVKTSCINYMTSKQHFITQIVVHVTIGLTLSSMEKKSSMLISYKEKYMISLLLCVEIII